MSKNAVVVQSTFPSQSVKNTTCSDHFGRPDVVLRGRHKGLCICSSFKSVGRRGTFEEDLERCIFRGRRSTSSSEMLGGQGADFLRGVAF